MRDENGGRRNGMVQLDIAKVERARIRRGFSKAELANEAELSRGTVIKACRGEGVFPDTAKRLAATLDVDVVELLADESAPPAPAYSLPSTAEWEFDTALGDWTRASNGLQFRVCRMKHRFDADRAARGKFYDLLQVPTLLRDELNHQLMRHSTVCSRVNPHPHIIDHLSCVPISERSGWWVVDRWIDATPLSDLIADDSIERDRIPVLCTEIIDALDTLHSADIVFRELSPTRVLICQQTGRAVLTDFELAKLLGNAPSVSVDWPEDEYRAPEVESGVCTPASDYFSWARILLELAVGELPSQGEEAEFLLNAALPKSLWKLVSDSLSPIHTDRPVKPALFKKALSRWKPRS